MVYITKIDDELIVTKVMPFIDAVKHLNPENLYKAEALCVEFWHKTKPACHSYIGDRLKILSLNGALPLEIVRKDSDKALMYRLK